MRVESVDAPSLLELRAIVARRMHMYGAFDGYSTEERRTILGQACMVIWHLTAGEQGRLLYRTHLGHPADGVPYQMVLDTLARLCPDIVDALQEYIAMWRARFWQDGWHPTQWGPCCDGVNETLLQVFVTDTRQQVLAAYERTIS